MTKINFLGHVCIKVSRPKPMSINIVTYQLLKKVRTSHRGIFLANVTLSKTDRPRNQ